MIEYLNDLDTKAFYLINAARNDFFDWFFAVISSHLFFAIVVAGIFLAFSYKNFKKTWWIVLLIIGLCFLLGDRVSVMGFKEVFERPRPSHALEDAFLVKFKDFQLVYNSKGGLYGFVSSHSANAFCIAMAFSLLSRKRLVVFLLFIWALLTGYSRIYCGVHYPGDVICGGLLGVLLGWLIYLLYSKLKNKFPKIGIKD
jgi:undecaprenyl-diphosphatase